MEQDRAPPVFVHHDELEGPATGQLPRHRRSDQRHDNRPGLTVHCELAETHRVCGWDSADYRKGIVVSDREIDGFNISREAFHAEWNYTMQPNTPSARALVSG